MKVKLLALVLLTAGAVFGQISLGVRIGTPPPPRVLMVQPQSPGEGYAWIGGYWYPVGHRYRWHEGYWTRPAYEGARWVEPRHDGERYYAGHWDGPRGRIEHDHHSDRNHDRDAYRDRR